MDYAELIKRLRDDSARWAENDKTMCNAAADAITKLRAERDAMRAQLAAAQDTIQKLTLMHAERTVERDALRLEVGVLRSQILGERVGMGCIDGASFPQALSIALQTESAMNNAMKAKK